MDEKLKKIIMIVLVGFFLLFLFLFLLTSCKKKYDPKDLELKIADSAKSYFSIHTDELPSEGGIYTLTLEDLVTKGIIKELDKILEKGTTCSGTLTIENNNDYYMYSPSLSCTTSYENYITENLNEVLLSNVVTSGNGLYNLGTKYYFRGDTVDNRLIFDGILWRIIGINEDGTIRIIEENKRDSVMWDDRYNTEKSTSNGINDFIQNNINSRIKDTLDNIYETEDVLSNDGKGYIKKTNLCVGKRSETDTIIDGSLECSNIIENQYIGLLQLNEYFLASLDVNCVDAISDSCRNYNYLADFSNSYWTITADSTNTYKVYKISNTISLTNANSYAMPRMVINISENTNVTGSGTESDPYVVVGFDNELKDFK